MDVNMEILMQYVTYMLAAVGVLAFFVSLITQVIKEMPRLKDVQTNVVALSVSLVLCPLSVIIACQYFLYIVRSHILDTFSHPPVLTRYTTNAARKDAKT